MNKYICYYRKSKFDILLSTKYISAFSEGEAAIKVLKKLPKDCIVDTTLKVNKNLFTK